MLAATPLTTTGKSIFSQHYLETQLNECVYALFDLSATEIRIVEESTKYRYGEV